MKTKKVKRPKIHIGLTGGVRVDPDEFLAQPEVQEAMEALRKMDIVGKKLVGYKLVSPEDNPKRS